MHISHTIHPSRLAFNHLDLALQRLFGRNLESSFTSTPDILHSADVYEDESHYHVLFDLPGVKKEEVSVQASDGVLSVSISAEKKDDSAASQTSLRREIILPDDAREGEISASLENGILHLSLAKPARPEVRTIAIN